MMTIMMIASVILIATASLYTAKSLVRVK